MKRTGLLISFLLMIILTNGQSVFSFFGGPQTTTAKFTVGPDVQNTESKYGFHLGVAKKINFDNQFFFYPSISYSLKGYKVTLQNPSSPPGLDIVYNNTSIHSIDFSPHFQVDFSKNTSHLFFRFGPTFDAAILGKEEVIFQNGNKESRDMIFSFSNYGRIGASLVSQFGYETENKFFIGVRYDYGVGSISNADGGPKITNRILALSLGLYIPNKKPK